LFVTGCWDVLLTVMQGNIRGALDAFNHSLDLAQLLGLYAGLAW